jgi:hypothetical protein
MQQIPVDLREGGRYVVDVAGILQVEGNVYVVRVLDVSGSSLRVRSAISIPVGSRVVVTSCHTDIVGEVQNARAMGVKEFWLDIRADKAADGGFDLTPFLGLITPRAGA